MASHRLPHLCTRLWYAAGTAPLASVTAPPPVRLMAAEYVPTTSSPRNEKNNPPLIPVTSQALRTPLRIAVIPSSSASTACHRDPYGPAPVVTASRHSWAHGHSSRLLPVPNPMPDPVPNRCPE